jgi:hypothetical protein
VLKADHRDVEQLFKRFERASENAHEERRRIADQVIAALSQHSAIEERLLYPWMRDYIENRDEEVLEAVEEHRMVKWLLTEIAATDERDEAFSARMAVLTEAVRHHVKEEESELFVDLRNVATRAELLELGEALTAAKRNAPKTPDVDGTIARVAASVGHARTVGHEVVDRVESLVGM